MGEEGGLWSVCELFVGALWVGQASGSFSTFFKAFTNKHTHTHIHTHTHTHPPTSATSRMASVSTTEASMSAAEGNKYSGRSVRNHSFSLQPINNQLTS